MADAAFMIDSNIAIYILKDAQCVPAERLQHLALGSAITSAISYAEVMRGIPIQETEAIATANALFDIVAPVAFDHEAAAAYVQVPFKRHRFDRLIAAHALSLGLTLVTNNETDFAGVPGLKVENWTAVE